jgi:hypothetical protein
MAFLGCRISGEGSQLLPVRVADLQVCPPTQTIRQLRKFLGMLNFYRPFLPNAATTQAPLLSLLAGPRTRGSQPIDWTPELRQAFENCKAGLSRAAKLAHPAGAAPLPW